MFKRDGKVSAALFDPNHVTASDGGTSGCAVTGNQETFSVENIGVFNSAQGAEAFGLRNLKRVYWNLEAPALYEQSLTRAETKLVKGGALLAETGIHTGRSPKDKFVVRDDATESKIGRAHV